MDIIIIGGGASGIFAAINLKKNNNRVLILEKNPRIGKKLLATGNGRCNYSNMNLSPSNYNNPDFVRNSLENFSNEDLINFFKLIGLNSTYENNRLYPVTLKANSVLAVLMAQLKRKKVEIETDSEVINIKRQGNKFKLFTKDKVFSCDKLIFACGGSSMPGSGSDGRSYKLLENLGHTITKIYPALTQIKLKSSYLKHLSGTKVVGEVKIYAGQKLIDKRYGDLLFTEYGISGPPILDLSKYLSLYNDINLKMPLINHSENFNRDEIYSFFYMHGDYSIEDLLVGLVDKKFIHYILGILEIDRNEPVGNLEKYYRPIINMLFESEFAAISTTGFKNSQVTGGGVTTDEVSNITFESKIQKGLYIIGEVLDIDGDCGGYNLHFAFASAYNLGINFYNTKWFTGGYMFYLLNKIKDRDPIKVGIVGLGIMGKSLLTTLRILDGFGPALIAARRRESLTEAFGVAGISENEYIITDDIDKARIALKNNKYVGSLDINLASTLTDVVVDATGDTNTGTIISLNAIKNKVHIVSLNVEMDSTVGPYLKDLAKDAGVVYSGTAGDEPGAIIDLYDFCKSCGFDVLVLGKGKNNKLDNFANQDDLADDAKRRGINKRMLTSFVDGTNTMLELNAVCNAVGFAPDVRGCHFFTSSPKKLTDDIKLKEDGGLLNSYGIVDFVKGIAPGVFAIVKTKSTFITDEMKYLSMGDGENFAIYRPYHLTSLETPKSIMRAVILGDSTIAPKDKPYAESVTVAKKDIKRGEKFDGIGGYTVFGSLEKAEIQKRDILLPIGILTEGALAKRDIKKGSLITYDDVDLNEESQIVKIRRLQDEIYWHNFEIIIELGEINENYARNGLRL